MTKEQINLVLERVRNWPAARQEDAAQLLLAMEAQGSKAPICCSEDERAEVDGCTSRKWPATKSRPTQEVAAVFNRYSADEG